MAADALLLGRVTYEAFAAAWPGRENMGEFGERLNSIPKYVVSSTLSDPEWANTSGGHHHPDVRRTGRVG